MSKINWKMIAFWGALWWFIYTAPTEDSFAHLIAHMVVPGLPTDAPKPSDDW